LGKNLAKKRAKDVELFLAVWEGSVVGERVLHSLEGRERGIVRNIQKNKKLRTTKPEPGLKGSLNFHVCSEKWLRKGKLIGKTKKGGDDSLF